MMRETLLGPDRAPCTPPPWGELVAFDLARGMTRWRVPLGDVTGLEGRGYGSPSLGGVLLTRGGLAFVAGTLDRHLRAIDLATGRELWSAPLTGRRPRAPDDVHGRRPPVRRDRRGRARSTDARSARAWATTCSHTHWTAATAGHDVARADRQLGRRPPHRGPRAFCGDRRAGNAAADSLVGSS